MPPLAVTVQETAVPAVPCAGQLTEAVRLVGGGPLPPTEIVAVVLVEELPLVTWTATM